MLTIIKYLLFYGQVFCNFAFTYLISMIRKSLHILFALLMLVSTGGLFLNQHYCHNQLTQISVNSVPDNCCGSTCNHCHNESVYVKIVDVFTISEKKVGDFFSFQFLSYALFTELFQVNHLASKQVYCQRAIPPEKGNTPIYTLIANFRL